MSGVKKLLAVVAAFAAMLVLSFSIAVIIRNTYNAFRNPEEDSMEADTSSVIVADHEGDGSIGDKAGDTGDVNGDSSINAGDAAIILNEASLYGSGHSGELNDAQMKAADVNGDGKVNAEDAAIVLAYAAADGAGIPDLRIEDFIIAANE